jgi:UrcA family protein
VHEASELERILDMLRLSLFAISAVALTSAAPAKDPITIDGTAPSIQISYADLNLLSEAGRMTLEGRVRGAAKKLCPEYGVVSLKEAAATRACFEEAVASASPQIELALRTPSSSEFAQLQRITLQRRR